MTLITAAKADRVAFPPRIKITGLPRSRYFPCRQISQTQDFAALALVRSSSKIEAIDPFCQDIIRSKNVQFSVQEVEEVIRKHDVKTIVNLAWNKPFASTQNAQFEKDRIPLEAAFQAAIAVSPEIHVITSSGNFSLITAEGGRITETPPPKGFPKPNYLEWGGIIMRGQFDEGCTDGGLHQARGQCLDRLSFLSLWSFANLWGFLGFCHSAVHYGQTLLGLSAISPRLDDGVGSR